MSSTGEVERKFGVDRKRIREWIQNESKMQNKVGSKNQSLLNYAGCVGSWVVWVAWVRGYVEAWVAWVKVWRGWRG